ncbi:hypothetical protein [Allisonella histaminiformans]|uniref:MuF-C-terminal domain-containing protein n=1 Tax=Allisonella histaminiformans TaxID=209880 RepID=UPI003C6CFBC2
MKIRKIFKDHPEITYDILKRIPKEIANPVMILKSATVAGRQVIILNIKGTNGLNVIAPVQLDVKKSYKSKYFKFHLY